MEADWSRAQPGAAAACSAVKSDLDVVRQRLDAGGINLPGGAFLRDGHLSASCRLALRSDGGVLRSSRAVGRAYPALGAS